MNNSTVTSEELVQQLNDEMAQLFIPATAFTCILMVTGLVGNLMVCYYYGFKTKMTPTSVFIVVLAVYDLITCIVTMPVEIVVSHHYYTYGNTILCKSIYFISTFVIIGSVFTLPVIAVDRFRHLCASRKYKTTVQGAIKQCVIVAILGLSLAWPAIILYDITDAPLQIRNGSSIQHTMCSVRKEWNSYVFVLDLVYLIIFFLCMVILVVLYFRIIKVIYIHHQKLRKSKALQNSDNHDRRIDIMTTKLTIGMIVITTVFFLSFIPRLSLLVLPELSDGRHLSDAERVGLEIGIQSYMLNSSLNPWIYGIFNSQFRNFYFRKLCSACSRSPETTVTASVEVADSTRV